MNVPFFSKYRPLRGRNGQLHCPSFHLSRPVTVPTTTCRCSAFCPSPTLLLRVIRWVTPLLISFYVLSPTLQAQYRRNQPSIMIYPVIGLNASQIEGDNLKGFKHFGFTAGLGAIVPISSNENWQVSIETTVSQRGVRETSRTVETPYNITGLTLNYVDIPVVLHYLDPHGKMLFGIGLSYSRLVQQPHGTLSFNPSYFVPDTSDMSFLRNDIMAVADFRFTIWRSLRLNFRVGYSILPIKKDWVFTQYRNSSGALPITESRDCYNFVISTRLLWQFEEQHNYRSKYRKRR